MTWLSDLLAAVGISGVSPGLLQLWVPVLVLPMLILAFLTVIEAHLKLSRLTWAVGLYLTGLLVATGQILIPAQTGPFHLIGSYPAAGLTLLSLGAIMLLTLGAQATTTKSTNSRRLPMRGLTGLVAIAAVGLIVVSVGSGTTSAGTTSGGALTTQEHGTVPALAADRAADDVQARTLRLDVVDGEVRARLLSSADGTVIGTSTIHSAEAVGGWPWERRPLPISEDETLIAQAAAALSADDAGDVRAILGELGVDFVLVDSDAKNLRNSVAAADGVVEVGPTESGGLWQVDTPYNGRFLVREPDGTLSTAPMDGTTAEVAAGEDGRTLIASDASGNITASIDGKDLPAPEKPTNDWAAEFSLPAAGETSSSATALSSMHRESSSVGSSGCSPSSSQSPSDLSGRAGPGRERLVRDLRRRLARHRSERRRHRSREHPNRQWRRSHETHAQHRDLRGDRRARRPRRHHFVPDPADPGYPRPQPRTGEDAHRRHPRDLPRPAADR